MTLDQEVVIGSVTNSRGHDEDAVPIITCKVHARNANPAVAAMCLDVAESECISSFFDDKGIPWMSTITSIEVGRHWEKSHDCIYDGHKSRVRKIDKISMKPQNGGVFDITFNLQFEDPKVELNDAIDRSLHATIKLKLKADKGLFDTD